MALASCTEINFVMGGFVCAMFGSLLTGISFIYFSSSLSFLPLWPCHLNRFDPLVFFFSCIFLLSWVPPLLGFLFCFFFAFFLLSSPHNLLTPFYSPASRHPPLLCCEAECSEPHPVHLAHLPYDARHPLLGFRVQLHQDGVGVLRRTWSDLVVGRERNCCVFAEYPFLPPLFVPSFPPVPSFPLVSSCLLGISIASLHFLLPPPLVISPSHNYTLLVGVINYLPKIFYDRQ